MFAKKTYAMLACIASQSLVEISPDEQKDCFDILKKPFEVSLIDRVKMGNIRYTGDDRLRHIEKTNQYKSVFVPITAERMKEWDESEK